MGRLWKRDAYLAEAVRVAARQVGLENLTGHAVRGALWPALGVLTPGISFQ